MMATAEIRKWPLYLRNVKQVMRAATPPFDERAYGFANLTDLLRAAHRDNLVRMERDRQGVIRVFQSTNAPAVEAAASTPPPREPEIIIVAPVEAEVPIEIVESTAEPAVVDVVADEPSGSSTEETSAPAKGKSRRGGRGRGSRGGAKKSAKKKN